MEAWHYACGEVHEEGYCPNCPYCGERFRDSDGECDNLDCRAKAEAELADTICTCTGTDICKNCQLER